MDVTHFAIKSQERFHPPFSIAGCCPSQMKHRRTKGDRLLRDSFLICIIENVEMRFQLCDTETTRQKK
jgi:hypothetical protein